jgi:DNA repair protein RadB
MNDSRIDFGSDVINKLLNGGLERGIITTVFGASGTGKSNLAVITALNMAKIGKVIFVDTESGFSLERAKQISPDYENLLKNIHLIKPLEFEDQQKAIRDLRELVKKEKINLIVVDSLTMLYRLERPGDPKEINLELTKQLSILSSIARRNEIPIFVTNQVYSSFDKRDEIRMVGGEILAYWSKCLIRLDKINGVRRAQLAKHRSMPEGGDVYFEIVNEGVKETEKPKEERKGFSLF